MKRFVIAAACVAGCDAGTHPPAKSTPEETFDVTGPRAYPAPEPIDAALAAVIADGPAQDRFAALFDGPRAMMTRDGAFVLLYVIDADGARGQPNLALEIRDRKDRTLERVVVLGVEEAELDAPTRATRAAAAQKLIASRAFVALGELEGAPDDAAHFEGAGIAIDWSREHMTITQDGKRVVDRAVPAKWRGGSYYNKVEDLRCENPDFLAGAYAVSGVPILVVDVAYRGTDTCWEPTAQLHVLSW
jgi:hypothetical protein